ncbi:hypothetical protein AALA26_01825 [Bifidobacterium pseudolongum]|uniref:hypothetical protein n=1 Tax=Bifidobacterium pseudolongum TaxID=1694 RepID=UPI001F1A2D6C|nr:hypothetical protein [Bifidobacterium pseudolongum]MCH4856666.1 hypothetical protein [Bifidobacterium pseudolongum]
MTGEIIDDTLKAYDSAQPLPDSVVSPAGEYRPVFDPTIRTAIYVVCLLMGVTLTVVSPVVIAAHAPEWVCVLLSALAGAIPTIAAGFGVAYNPNRSTT